MFALVDCNNFYASCERLFRPDLKHRPVIVLSNNDGCVIARSEETKALGIKMGEAFFKVKHLVQQHNIAVFSSNFSLYGDLSARVMQTLEIFTPEIEIYSIDEAFLGLHQHNPEQQSWDSLADAIRRHIQQHIGIPVCVGIAPTKTLAKLANHRAKKHSQGKGYCTLATAHTQQFALEQTNINDLWGIGNKLSARLHTQGIHNAWQLAQLPTNEVQKRFSIVEKRLVMELNGTPCLSLEEVQPVRKQMLHSRSFTPRITDKTMMQAVLMEFCIRCATKLRKEQLSCQHLTLFLRNNPHNKGGTPFRNNAHIALELPTQDGNLLGQTTFMLLEKIWSSQAAIAKAGIILSDFSPAQIQQNDLFSVRENAQKQHNLEALLGQLNTDHSRTLIPARMLKLKKKPYERAQKSPRFTTNWEELLKVK